MNDNLRRAALNRHRKRLFGDAALSVQKITPEAGEQLVATFAADWSGHRTVETTAGSAEAGSWQFKIWAADDWQTSQAFMLQAATLTVDGRRWVVKKIERPIGRSTVWKLRTQIQ
jgi:hypothetical protein